MPNNNNLDQHSITYARVPPVVRGKSTMSETCSQCDPVTPVSECTVQEHWEKRLHTYKLTPERAGDPRIIGRNPETGKRTKANRLVQMDRDPDTIVVGPLVTPDDPELREIFVMDSLGMTYPKPPRRFWYTHEYPIGSTYIKTHRMGLEYGQEMPHD